MQMVTSVLNPNAPVFVPSAYRAVEDFSDEWWELVQSSPWFRDYWLQECFSDPQIESPFLGIDGDDVPGDDDAAKRRESRMHLVALASLKWSKARRGAAATPRYSEKPPKIVSVKVNPRPIQQPR